MGKIALIRRQSGRPNSEVIVAFVRDAVPETIISYDELGRVLEEGSESRYTRAKICAAVRRANRRLLPEHHRELRNVATIGYRIVPAREHLVLGRDRQRRGERQIKRGLLTMKHVRWDELSPAERQAHLAQLMISEGLMQNIRSIEHRQDRHASLINSILDRVEKIEQAEK